MPWKGALQRLPIALACGALAGACKRPLSPEEYLARERSYLRLGVELEEEEAAVRRVLAQRKLSVAAEVRGPIFVGLGASTFDSRISAIRVISPRGVVVAEDAAHDDLFAPAELELFERFPTTLGDYMLVAWTRIPHGRDLGCASLYRVLADGSAVQAILDVSLLGPRACVAELSRAPSGELSARLAFPGLYADGTPSLLVELAFQTVPLGREAPLIPVAKLASAGLWLEAERARLESLVRPNAGIEERHALGVARAALALLSGLDKDAQVAVYRSSVGRVMPGSAAGRLVAETLDYIEQGWSDPSEDAPAPTDGHHPGPDDVLIEPEGAPRPAPEQPDGSDPDEEDSFRIEPEPSR